MLPGRFCTLQDRLFYAAIINSYLYSLYSNTAMPDGTIVLHAVQSDLEEIRAIYNEVIRNTTAVYHYDERTPEWMDTWFEDKGLFGFPLLVAKTGGVVSGFATYGQFRPWAGYLYSVEHSVHVHHQYRGRGIAKLLLQELISEARKDQKHCIVAGIDADNTVSINLHKKFGFTEAGHFKQVGYKFNRWLDLTFMQLLLDTPDNLGNAAPKT